MILIEKDAPPIQNYNSLQLIQVCVIQKENYQSLPMPPPSEKWILYQSRRHLDCNKERKLLCKFRNNQLLVAHWSNFQESYYRYCFELHYCDELSVLNIFLLPNTTDIRDCVYEELFVDVQFQIDFRALPSCNLISRLSLLTSQSASYSSLASSGSLSSRPQPRA